MHTRDSLPVNNPYGRLRRGLKTRPVVVPSPVHGPQALHDDEDAVVTPGLPRLVIKVRSPPAESASPPRCGDQAMTACPVERYDDRRC